MTPRRIFVHQGQAPSNGHGPRSVISPDGQRQLVAWRPSGLTEIARRAGVEAVVARQGSAFCIYYMDHAPRDWHDLAEHHEFRFDEEVRRQMISRGVYVFPLATKQWSLSCAHTAADVEQTLAVFEESLKAALDRQPPLHRSVPLGKA